VVRAKKVGIGERLDGRAKVMGGKGERAVVQNGVGRLRGASPRVGKEGKGGGEESGEANGNIEGQGLKGPLGRRMGLMSAAKANTRAVALPSGGGGGGKMKRGRGGSSESVGGRVVVGKAKGRDGNRWRGRDGGGVEGEKRRASVKGLRPPRWSTVKGIRAMRWAVRE
jgi:hypothetical protein